MRLLLLALLAVAGCGDDTTNASSSMDLSVAQTGPDMQLLSRCGHPGDTGNSLGVGQFCTNDGPNCLGNSMAKSCSSIQNGSTPSATDTYFCSFICQATDPPTVCGENAKCLCNTVACACIPQRCIPAGDGGA